jgi:uncharacterized membrane protein YfcA
LGALSVIIQIILFSFIGLIAGFFSGLLGIGGGMIVVPGVYFILKSTDPKSLHLMQISGATALSSMVFTTFASMLSHKKNKNIEFSILKKMIIGVFLGASLGVFINNRLESSILQLFFSIFLIGFGFYSINYHKIEASAPNFKAPAFISSTIFSSLISFLSSLLGIGGGIFSIQYFSYIKLKFKKAVGTASAMSFLITTTAAIVFLFSGNHSDVKLSTSKDYIGYIYLIAFFSIGLSSMFAAPLGVKALHAFDTLTIKKIFGGFICIVGLYMFFQSIYSF